MSGTRAPGRPATVAEVLAAWSERTGVPVEAWLWTGTPVPARVAGALARALREALGAVEDGERPAVVHVACTSGARGVRLTVSHEGGGEPWPASRIAALSAAFAEVGGLVTVNSVPAGGTTMTGVVRHR
ncbi:hypothetical protein ACBI99_17245 [Nonomuraea sp. ATR24]|uniref:hypothetical protein n=1 Tax=Nonomuraea TaxID=83681 RepID=UPI001C5D8507|nr:hypothetical protein [Nonomuraea ceibae]